MTESFFQGETPVNANNNDASPYTLGFRFECLADGQVTHLAFYRSTGGVTGTMNLILWRNINQAQLANESRDGATFSAGWNLVELSSPVTLTVGESYTASYYTPNGYVSTGAYPWPKSSSGGSLLTPSPAGYFSGEFTPSYPNSEFNAGNYFADLVFVPDASGPAVTVWNGTTELTATATVWNGATEDAGTIEIAT